MLGLSLSAFTLLHVVISLVAIASGFIVVFGMFGGKRMDGMTALFLATTVLTSVTGFLFPFTHLLPSHILGIMSLVLLAIAILARYPQHMNGGWRKAYVICAVLSLYFNVFVLVVQGFEKVPFLHALAPTQKEAPFAIAQLALLLLFIWLTIASVRRFRQA